MQIISKHLSTLAQFCVVAEKDISSHYSLEIHVVFMLHHPLSSDASSKGCIVQGTHRPRDSSSKGFIVQGTIHLRYPSAKTCFVQGRNIRYICGHTVRGKYDNAGNTLFPKARKTHSGCSNWKMKDKDKKRSLRHWLLILNAFIAPLPILVRCKTKGAVGAVCAIGN